MITTRKASDQDKEFLWNLKVTAMGPHIDRVYGWQEAAQRRYFEDNFRPQAVQIIEQDGRDVGMYELQERQEDWVLARIAILPAFQNQGIGTAILRRIIIATEPTHKPLRLQVFKVNPARRLYERLGFVKTGETETHIQMELANLR